MNYSDGYSRCDCGCNIGNSNTFFENAAVRSCSSCGTENCCFPQCEGCGLSALCNLCGVQAQMTSGTNVEKNKPVLFNNILVGCADIGYAQSTGEFTLMKRGVYYVSWKINVSLKSGTVVKFGIMDAGTLIAAEDEFVSRGKVCGSALIKVTSAPMTVQLINLTSSSVAYDTACSVIADMEIIRAV